MPRSYWLPAAGPDLIREITRVDSGGRHLNKLARPTERTKIVQRDRANIHLDSPTIFYCIYSQIKNIPHFT